MHTTEMGNMMLRWRVRDDSLIRMRDALLCRPGGGQISFEGRECQSPPESRTHACKNGDIEKSPERGSGHTELGLCPSQGLSRDTKIMNYGKREKKNIGCK